MKEKEMVKLTTEEKEIVGNQIVEILMLRKDAENKGRYLTTWGKNSNRDIETVLRLINDPNLKDK